MTRDQRSRIATFALQALAGLLWLTCLSCDLPVDPHRTYERVQGGTLRAGVTEEPPWARLADPEPKGIEPELLRRFARRLEARIVWQKGSETKLVEALRQGELDVIIGVPESSPWSKEAGTTRPYGASGSRRRVMLVRHGENRWLLELDRFLHEQEAEIGSLIDSERRP